uniref:Uncharacterized protein n=1 Tax=Anguilla anguilla TaxID=7936 RepID=A0A0E9WNT2_ANGAN
MTPETSYCINPSGTSVSIGSIPVTPDVTASTTMPSHVHWEIDPDNSFIKLSLLSRLI